MSYVFNPLITTEESSTVEKENNSEVNVTNDGKLGTEEGSDFLPTSTLINEFIPFSAEILATKRVVNGFCEINYMETYTLPFDFHSIDGIIINRVFYPLDPVLTDTDKREFSIQHVQLNHEEDQIYISVKRFTNVSVNLQFTDINNFTATVENGSSKITLNEEFENFDLAITAEAILINGLYYFKDEFTCDLDTKTIVINNKSSLDEVDKIALFLYYERKEDEE